MGMWSNLWREQAHDWAYARLPDSKEQEIATPNKSYVSVMMRQLRLVNARVGFSRFYGAVEFYGRLPHLTGRAAEFISVNSPPQLHDIEKKKMGNLVLGSRRLLGPVPYRGGDLEIEIGLFAIKSQDLLKSYLDLLGQISGSAGVTLISEMAPYISVLKTGLSALTTAEGVPSLEIGLSATYETPQPGTYFVARLDSAGRDLSRFSVDRNYQLIDEQGKPVIDSPYLVFSIAFDPVREDWFAIPAIATAYDQLNGAVRDQRSLKDIESFFEHFRRVVLTDPDILLGHAQQVVTGVSQELELIRAARTARVEDGPELAELKTVRLTRL